ncbi:MAG TPA: hypoxanthine phosphoribosyltransferase [Candidatus Cloacimonadota bacterium]|nr:hypoxanthine phosphoribosyltransferase [Candidatus Cloacimonadota bacterium]HPT72474.1 hypoxanthine phosphoribosyltransferase [Candidatus Cloacimonadota bacterium]
MTKIHKDVSSILFDEQVIHDRIQVLGDMISKDYEGKNPVFICILKGSIIFLADLIRSVDIPLEIDSMAVSSYGNSHVSSGVVKIKKDIDIDLFERHVIIVEDIVDSGLSLQYIKEYLAKHEPASVKVCVFLDKPNAHKVPVQIDYCGFQIGNEFVVGYGLDYGENYRNLPYLGILKEEVYQ